MHDAPAITCLDTVLARAIVQRASDIHLESAPDQLQVRFRIDGLLRHEYTFDHTLGIQVIARIKVLASLILNMFFLSTLI